MIKVIDLDFKQNYNIDLPQSGTGEKISLCPVCSHNRKQHNQNKKCLSWNYDKQTGFCHNCNSSFVIPTDYSKKDEYKRPEWKNNTKLSDNVVKWFEGRKISQSTLKYNKITEGIEFIPQVNKEVNTIQFNYFRNDELINIKFRDGAKNFKLSSGAELIFYGLDHIKESDECIIVEGEMDKLALYEIGIHNCVSVPNGAHKSNNNLKYLDNCVEYFENKEKIILATDNDLPGVNLRNDLAARFGIEKCYKVNLKDCKDCNEFLIKYGSNELKEVFKKIEPFPIEGIFSANDFDKDLDILYRDGLKPGKQIEIPEIDKQITFEKGRLYTITGIPGHGKSEVLDFILERLNFIHGWKFGYFSPENHPLQLHASKLIEKITGMRFNSKTLPYKDYQLAKDYINENFFFVNPKDDYKVETILSSIRMLKFKYGIDGFVIDPYNKLEHRMENGENETNYISRFLDQIINFAKRNNIALFLVAHPRKMPKLANGLYEVPSLYDINGSANFYNKTDFGISVYRNMNSNMSTLYVQKVKFKHLGEVGSVDLMWNKNNGRYTVVDENEIRNKGNIIFDDKNHLKGKVNDIEEIDFYNNLSEISKDEIPF